MNECQRDGCNTVRRVDFREKYYLRNEKIRRYLQEESQQTLIIFTEKKYTKVHIKFTNLGCYFHIPSKFSFYVYQKILKCCSA